MTVAFYKKIRASDVLTSFTILVSIIALTINWHRDTQTRIRDQANSVRVAASRTLAKLERVQALQISLYRELEPVYVETSTRLATHFDVIEARDFLWNSIDTKRVQISSRVLAEDLETAYVDLFAYYPSIRDQFLKAIGTLKSAEVNSIYNLHQGTQVEVLSFRGRRAGYTTAQLGDVLRAASKKEEAAFELTTDAILKPVRTELYTLISKSDAELLN
jgi:hypothetical protein